MSFLAPCSPLEAVIFDWGQYHIDHGSPAPGGPCTSSSAADILPVLDAINDRLSRGEHP